MNEHRTTIRPNSNLFHYPFRKDTSRRKFKEYIESAFECDDPWEAYAYLMFAQQWATMNAVAIKRAGEDFGEFILKAELARQLACDIQYGKDREYSA